MARKNPSTVGSKKGKISSTSDDQSKDQQQTVDQAVDQQQQQEQIIAEASDSLGPTASPAQTVPTATKYTTPLVKHYTQDQHQWYRH